MEIEPMDFTDNICPDGPSCPDPECQEERRKIGILPRLSDDERDLMNHITRFGSDGYPINKTCRGWSWGPWRGIKGPPVIYRTKREAVASFEAYHTILLDRNAGRI